KPRRHRPVHPPRRTVAADLGDRRDRRVGGNPSHARPQGDPKADSFLKNVSLYSWPPVAPHAAVTGTRQMTERSHAEKVKRISGCRYQSTASRWRAGTRC